jgi:predicted HD phosphohydrolase
MTATPDDDLACRRRHLLARIAELFEQHGHLPYIDGWRGPVSLLDHALQCAQLSQWARASPCVVAAALLHDIGHLLALDGQAHDGADADHHAELGSRWLANDLPPDVTEPVRLHVAARRYLARVDTHYYANLSPLAQQMLARQGGVMTEFEAAEFEAHPHAVQAVALRRWDEAARHADKRTPPLAYYLAVVAELPQQATGVPAPCGYRVDAVDGA